MASYAPYCFFLCIIASFIALQSEADGTGSVIFLDSSSNRYFRAPPSDTRAVVNTLSLPEVAAAASVLLGFAPPATLSATSSSKLNEVLMPNPFNRPRTIFLLEVLGDSQFLVNMDHSLFSNALRSKVTLAESKADIQLSDEDEVSVVSLNERLNFNADLEGIVKELNDFATWLGVSYVSNVLEPTYGNLTISLVDGAHFTLHLSKQADREFAINLLSLIHNIQRAVELRQDFSEHKNNPAEILKGRFDGIKALQEQYGMNVAHQGLEVLAMSISKIFDSLQAAYRGKIVGVILSSETPFVEFDTRLDVVGTSSTRRWMEEEKEPLNPTIIAEVLLVRRTLAWITGLILVIATLLGIYFLLNMPLTRDTLLYSNVKLD